MTPALRAAAALAAALCLAAPPALAQEGEGDVVYVPTPQQVVETMLEMARVGPADMVIDLGSGDGRVIITAAKKHGARGLGVDLDRYLLKLANGLAAKEGVADRARFVEQNLFETDLAPATVITSYLLPEMNLKLRPKILALRPGTRVVAHDYDMGNWPADAERVLDVPGKTVGTPGKSYIFLYVVPARLAGTWQSLITHGRDSVPYEFSFDQEFQFAAGTARAGKREAKVPEFRLAGDRVEFTTRLAVRGAALDHRFAGTVKGDRIEGVVTIGQGAAQRQLPWTASLVQAKAMSDDAALTPRKYRHLKQ
jgi:hypothetical protein